MGREFKYEIGDLIIIPKYGDVGIVCKRLRATNNDVRNYYHIVWIGEDYIEFNSNIAYPYFESKINKSIDVGHWLYYPVNK